MDAEGQDRDKPKLNVYVKFWITDEQSQEIQRLAQERQLSLADVHRAAVRYYLRAQRDAEAKAGAEDELAELAAA